MEEVIDGIAEACRALGTPVVSGNVSLYNDSRGTPIWPTPVVGMLGLLEDVTRRCDIGFRGSGDVIVLLGDTDDDLGASTYLSALHGRVAGRPRIDLEREVALQALVRGLIADGVARSAHDCSDGGLAVAIAESAFRSGIGADCPDVPGGLAPHVALFAETQSRIVITIAPADWETCARQADEAGVPIARLGETGGDRLGSGRSMSRSPRRDPRGTAGSPTPCAVLGPPDEQHGDLRRPDLRAERDRRPPRGPRGLRRRRHLRQPRRGRQPDVLRAVRRPAPRPGERRASPSHATATSGSIATWGSSRTS